MSSHDNPVTRDLATFGRRELALAAKLLTAYSDVASIDDFADDGVTVANNTSSGLVFLTNVDYQVAMLHDGKLEAFYSCPKCGAEGFRDELEPQCLRDLGFCGQPSAMGFGCIKYANHVADRDADHVDGAGNEYADEAPA